MIYFDNAATSKYKPFRVRHAALQALKKSANPGRGSHDDAIKAATIVHETRNDLLRFVGARETNAVFTKNCTEALNLAILGTVKPGGHVITTTLEHNSVLRPLYMLKEAGLITLTIIRPRNNEINVSDIEKAIHERSYLVAITTMSNVTGYAPPLERIGALCKDRGLLFLADGAQGLGHYPINMDAMHIDILCGAGHKGLHGMQGTGFLVFNKTVFINPIMYGGTGTESDRMTQPLLPPESLESGTLNYPGIAALRQGIIWTEKHKETNNKKSKAISEYLHDEISKLDELTLFSIKGSPIVTFSSSQIDTQLIADRLNEDYKVAVRYGLHCAPLALKQKDVCPTIRISIGVNNTMHQARYLISALRSILSKKAK